MKVLIGGFATTALRAGFLSIAGHRSVVTPARLIVAAHVESIMMVVTLMMGGHVFVVVVFARFVGLITRFHTAFLVGVLGFLAVHVARLEILVAGCRGTLFAACIAAVSILVVMLTVLRRQYPSSCCTLHHLSYLQWSSKWQSLQAQRSSS